MIIGFIILIKGADIFVDGASSLANNFKVSKVLIGLTIVAFGTSAPEFAVSIKSMLAGSGDIVLGNVIGSNIFNIFFILGLSSAITPLTLEISSLIDIIMMTSVEILVYLFMLRKLEINRKKGLFMLFIYASYIVYIILR